MKIPNTCSHCEAEHDYNTDSNRKNARLFFGSVVLYISAVFLLSVLQIEREDGLLIAFALAVPVAALWLKLVLGFNICPTCRKGVLHPIRLERFGLQQAFIYGSRYAVAATHDTVFWQRHGVLSPVWRYPLTGIQDVSVEEAPKGKVTVELITVRGSINIGKLNPEKVCDFDWLVTNGASNR